MKKLVVTTYGTTLILTGATHFHFHFKFTSFLTLKTTEDSTLLSSSADSTHSKMTAHPEIVAALKETLDRTGTLDTVRSILRTDIHHCLNDSMQNLEKDSNEEAPSPPHENILINELVAEYLAFNGYSNTLSVLAAESRSPSLLEARDSSKMLGPDFIRAELGLKKAVGSDISTGRRRAPLAILYEIVETLKVRNRSRVATS